MPVIETFDAIAPAQNEANVPDLTRVSLLAAARRAAFSSECRKTPAQNEAKVTFAVDDTCTIALMTNEPNGVWA
jgi:hypothetical protein